MIHVYQFIGLLWATEYNAHHAGVDRGIEAKTVNGINTVLTAYAALEALVLETAFLLHAALYEQRASFRHLGLEQKYTLFLATDGRPDEPLPALINEVSSARIALTHSEPDNQRSRHVGKVISAADAVRLAEGVREVAIWLWHGRNPNPVASEFDRENVFLVSRTKR